MILTLAIAALLLSLLPTAMFFSNLPLFCVDHCSDSDAVEKHEKGDSGSSDAGGTGVSVLIPARDEEDGIAKCVVAALNSENRNANSCEAEIESLEVVVLDDDSADATAEIVQMLGDEDVRVRLIPGQPLPGGWNGKQHACWQLANAAANEHLVFLDADVELAPEAISKLLDYKSKHQVALLSAFPRQITETWAERWLIPMMHFILLGYLPLARMRAHGDPSLGAGCGQLFVTTKQEYRRAGTHEAISASRHDGIALPRAYRQAGLATDVIDGSRLASCRMYRGAKEVFRGLLKNADEGIANPRLIGIFTVLLIGCSLLPLFSLGVSLWAGQQIAITVSLIALLLSHLPRLVAASRLQQSWWGAVCHLPATTLFVVLQWIALANHLLGWRIAWRGRSE